jgi:hypothetical protein
LIQSNFVPIKFLIKKYTMIRKIFTMFGLLATGFAAQAQLPNWVDDSVSMGPSYGKDIYYSLSNGSQRIEPNKNWHLGFSLSLLDSGAVWANHNAGASFVKVYNPHKNFAQWATVSLADIATSDSLYNHDQGWHQGAFNDIASPSSTNFGWGVYDQITHSLSGDSVFIIKADTNFYKFCLKKLDAIPMNWAFEYAKLTSSGSGVSVIDTVRKQPNFSSNLFAYYNLDSAKSFNREPAIDTWDIQFLRYTTNDPLSGQNLQNTVNGVYLNRGVTAARVQNTEVDSAFVKYSSYSRSSILSTIGYNWKIPPSTAGWVVPDSNSYIIKDKIGNIYQLQFLKFAGSGTGNIYFHKRIIIPLSLKDVNSAIATYNVYPNPSNSVLNIMLEAKRATPAQISISDITGKHIMSKRILINEGVNGFDLPVAQLANGNYMLLINGQSIELSHQFSVSK